MIYVLRFGAFFAANASRHRAGEWGRDSDIEQEWAPMWSVGVCVWHIKNGIDAPDILLKISGIHRRLNSVICISLFESSLCNSLLVICTVSSHLAFGRISKVLLFECVVFSGTFFFLLPHCLSSSYYSHCCSNALRRLLHFIALASRWHYFKDKSQFSWGKIVSFNVAHISIIYGLSQANGNHALQHCSALKAKPQKISVCVCALCMRANSIHKTQ